MMLIRFSEFANNELIDACDWYELQQSGLGLRFKRDVREAVQRIAVTPLLFPIELGEVRRYIMNRFPYILRYVLRKDEIWVMAISHQHRRPDYWIERV
jgi:plasmid stabilization system protein ParE